MKENRKKHLLLKLERVKAMELSLWRKKLKAEKE